MPLPIGPFPYQLINGTLADANQVMADFNWLLNGVNSLPWPLPGSQIANYNKLVNPFLEIDQANEGAALTGTALGSYVADGWFGNAASLGTFTGQRVADAPTGYSNSIQLTAAAGGSVAAGAYATFNTRIEADDLNDTGFGTSVAQPLTLSFWVKASQAGTYCVALRNAGVTRSYVQNFTIATASTWQLITMTIPGDTTGTWAISGNGLGCYLGFTPVCGTTYQTATLGAWQAGNFFASTTINNAWLGANATFQLGPAKLEVGSTATPMLRQSFQSELSRCQRYYEKSYPPGMAPGTSRGATGNAQGVFVAGAGGGAGLGCTAFYEVIKRAVPTVSIYGYSGAVGYVGTIVSGSWTQTANNVIGNNQSSHSQTVGSASNTGVSWDWVADARL